MARQSFVISLRKTLFILISAQIVYSYRTPTITYISKDQSKYIGDTVELVCSVQYLGDNSIMWIKKSNAEGISFKTASRFSIRDDEHDEENSTSTLQIRDIRQIDASKYICQVSMSINNSTAAVELIVLSPPVLLDNSTRSVIVSEEQSVDLECYASGYPTPTISWRRGNYNVLPTGRPIYRGNILKFNKIRKEHRGTYYCIADNGVGKAARHNVTVEVEFAPIVTIPQPRVGQTLDCDMDMECRIEAYPLPLVMWLKEDDVLFPSKQYSIEFESADEFTDSTLRAQEIRKRQYGKYVCKAVNKMGAAEAEVELFETIDPVGPHACYRGQVSDAISMTASSIGLLGVLPLFVYRYCMLIPTYVNIGI